MALFSFEQRKYIADLYRGGDYTQSSLATLIGTTQGNISKILKRARKNDPSLIRQRPPREREPRQHMVAASQMGSIGRPLNLDSL